MINTEREKEIKQFVRIFFYYFHDCKIAYSIVILIAAFTFRTVTFPIQLKPRSTIGYISSVLGKFMKRKGKIAEYEGYILYARRENEKSEENDGHRLMKIFLALQKLTSRNTDQLATIKIFIEKKKM